MGSEKLALGRQIRLEALDRGVASGVGLVCTLLAREWRPSVDASPTLQPAHARFASDTKRKATGRQDARVSSKPGTRSVRCEVLVWIAKQAPSGPWHPRRPTADDTARDRVDRPNGDTSNKRPVVLKGQKFVRILPERDYTQRLKKANPS